MVVRHTPGLSLERSSSEPDITAAGRPKARRQEQGPAPAIRGCAERTLLQVRRGHPLVAVSMSGAARAGLAFATESPSKALRAEFLEQVRKENLPTFRRLAGSSGSRLALSYVDAVDELAAGSPGRAQAIHKAAGMLLDDATFQAREIEPVNVRVADVVAAAAKRICGDSEIAVGNRAATMARELAQAHVMRAGLRGLAAAERSPEAIRVGRAGSCRAGRAEALLMISSYRVTQSVVLAVVEERVGRANERGQPWQQMLARRRDNIERVSIAEVDSTILAGGTPSIPSVRRVVDREIFTGTLTACLMTGLDELMRPDAEGNPYSGSPT